MPSCPGEVYRSPNGLLPPVYCLLGNSYSFRSAVSSWAMTGLNGSQSALEYGLQELLNFDMGRTGKNERTPFVFLVLKHNG